MAQQEQEWTNDFSSEAAWRGTLAEFFATLLFVFLGAGTVVVTGQLLGEQMTSARLLAIAVAHGLAIFLLASATAKISGGHINPAVSIATAVTREISASKAVMFVVAQGVGAIVGALLLNAVVPDPGNLGSHGLGTGVTPGMGVLAEIILTFSLVFVIYATAIDPKGLATLAPLAIGLTVLVDHLVGVPITGASMNPARSLGPAIVSGTWGNHWVYWVGPIVGGIVAAAVYKLLFMKPQE